MIHIRYSISLAVKFINHKFNLIHCSEDEPPVYVADANCNMPCPVGTDNCGALEYVSVYKAPLQTIGKILLGFTTYVVANCTCNWIRHSSNVILLSPKQNKITLSSLSLLAVQEISISDYMPDSSI